MDEDISAVRARYQAALEKGASIEEATRVANAAANQPLVVREPGELPPPPSAPKADDPPQERPVRPVGASQPFDHDGDGKPGGSSKPDDDADEIKAVRAEYQEKMGKRPFPGWGIDELRKRMAEAG
ncbi:MAG: hypothetical protein LOX97_02205 [Sphingomonas sp.]|nr:hypothetical protein [Sphingomonas sp.]